MDKFKVTNQNLPMLIGTKEEMDKIMSGLFSFKPVLSMEDHHKLVSLLKQNYNTEFDLEKQVKDGYIINFNELFTLGITAYPLMFEGDSFVPVDERYKELGDTAIIFIGLPIVLDQLRLAFKSIQPYMYDVVVYQPRYVDNIISLDYESCNVLKENEWKKEMLIQARMRSEFNVEDTSYPTINYCKLDSINDCAIELPLQTLIDGDFNKLIEINGLIDSMRLLKSEERMIFSYHKSFMADLRNIKPTNEWIDKFKEILNKDEWRPIKYE